MKKRNNILEEQRCSVFSPRSLSFLLSRIFKSKKKKIKGAKTSQKGSKNTPKMSNMGRLISQNNKDYCFVFGGCLHLFWRDQTGEHFEKFHQNFKNQFSAFLRKFWSSGLPTIGAGGNAIPDTLSLNQANAFTNPRILLNILDK